MLGSLHSHAPASERIPLPALVLGIAGLLPFVFFAALGWSGDPLTRGHALTTYFAYAASILSFLGGLHWALGLEPDLSNSERWLRMSWAVLPPLVAWAAVLAPWRVGIWLMLAMYVAQYGADMLLNRADPSHYPAWFMRLRFGLTVVVLLTGLAVATRI
ncbi:DUF3429 domain-containing protein [Jeongeupia naejangsanensis]|uniref:DUF3429 domain-containing protein n=1 Tax=Jeongeupia naejangsanensis TaxID=613195 RepID=A0ABS2BGM0_9NEIS|nr:DUF3429 domain-containing protein [Jeongeupia naejangsanensis]MBM3114753.1 DUF3429 domain-containing protein [Jeongeupia naejangsanensis]